MTIIDEKALALAHAQLEKVLGANGTIDITKLIVETYENAAIDNIMTEYFNQNPEPQEK